MPRNGTFEKTHPLDYKIDPVDDYFAIPRFKPSRVPTAIDVAALRKRLRMTQKQFCRRFGFSLPTLRHWERGDRKPRGAALTLLTVVRHDPRAVAAALLRSANRDEY